MKLRIVIFIFLFLRVSTGFAQIPEFSKLSGNRTESSELVKHGNGYFLFNRLFDPTLTVKIYKISEIGKVLDSIDLTKSGMLFNGSLRILDDKIYLCGLNLDTISINSQRYTAIEYDSDLNEVRRFESTVLDTLIAPLENVGTSDGRNRTLFNFTVYKDTIFAIGGYLLFDTLANILGGDVRYFKANFNGDVYQNRSFDGHMYNAFFQDNKMYFQGSNNNPNAPWLPPAVGVYDGNGQFINGWNFDNSTSGEFPWGACGGIIDDRLYFSYLGRDPSLTGCPVLTVAVDVRDTNFQVLHRFKVNECDYKYVGNMPFAKGKDGSIYFQAVHKGYKKFIVKKYTQEMQLIWSKEYNFESNPYFTIPMKLIPAEDGGVIAHCREELNGISFVRLYKISPDGDIISSTTFGEGSKREAAVLSPNPCMDEIRYTGPSTAALEAWLYSMDGRIQKRTVFEGGRLDMSTLPAGLYSVLIFEKDRPDVLLHRQTVVKVE